MPTDTTYVCVLTGRQMAAIGSVAIAGAGAKAIVGRIFRSGTAMAKHSLTVPPPKAILHGVIADGQRVVDEVVVGCEGPASFVIHCHGNPLLTEQVVKLAQTHGAVLTDTEHLTFERYRAESAHLIEAEAKLAMQTCATLTGVKILKSQIDGGLSVWAREHLDTIDTLDAARVKEECAAILNRSRIADYFTKGARIVIAGPPNAGKSTLLNVLAGQQQAIVSRTAGTTRDWVSVVCELKMPAGTDKNNVSLRVEFIDTAGLDDVLAGAADIDSQAQQITREFLESCDLVLFVRDATTLGSYQLPVINNTACPVVTAYNKCDLVKEYRAGLPEYREEETSVFISAKDIIRIDSLVRAIFKALGAGDFQYDKPVVFTRRQRAVLERICQGHPLKSCLEQIAE